MRRTYRKQRLRSVPPKRDHPAVRKRHVVAGVPRSTRTEVTDFDLKLVTHEAVSSCQVTVNYTQSLQVLHPSGDLGGHVDQRAVPKGMEIGFKLSDLKGIV